MLSIFYSLFHLNFYIFDLSLSRSISLTSFHIIKKFLAFMYASFFILLYFVYSYISIFFSFHSTWKREKCGSEEKSREEKLIIAVSHDIQAHTQWVFIHIIPFDLWYFVNQYNLFLYITYFNQFLEEEEKFFHITFIVKIFRVENVLKN